MNKAEALKILNDNTGKTAEEMTGWQRAAIRQAIYIVLRSKDYAQRSLAQEIGDILDGKTMLWETNRTGFIEFDALPIAPAQVDPGPGRLPVLDIGPAPKILMDYQSAYEECERIAFDWYVAGKPWPRYEVHPLSDNYLLLLYTSRDDSREKWRLYEVKDGARQTPSVAEGLSPSEIPF